MDQYIKALIYIFLGFIGAIFHWGKKRYIDNTLEISFWSYLTTNKKATIRTICSIIMTEVTLTTSSVEFLSLSELIGVLTAGYTADSALNSIKE